MDLLWISPLVPYDTVAHAGGKIENYYIKKFNASEKINLYLLTLAEKNELEKVDLDDYGVRYSLKTYSGSAIKNACRKVNNIGSALNPWHRNGHLLMEYERWLLVRLVNNYSKHHNAPDIIVLEWSGTLLLLPEIKKLFPGAYLVIIEEDVAFQGLQRRYEKTVNKFLRCFHHEVFKKGREVEKSGLKQCDLVVVYNQKDRLLLNGIGISNEKIVVTSPYYDNYEKAKNISKGNTLLFYGALTRPENIKCVEWIIKKIMPLLDGTNIELEIVGKTVPHLKQYEDGRVHIRGFVEDVTPYFEKSLCFIAPLQMGAGIKIKILEAMSAGVTVLTNEVGIEGIPATDGIEYYHCNTPEEYAGVILDLYNGKKPKLGLSARSLMEKEFNTEESTNAMLEIILNGALKKSGCEINTHQ